MRDIHEIEPGDFVKGPDGKLHEIKEIWGVGKGAMMLAPPSKGGFGVVTVDGTRIDMWSARAYLKKEDVV